MSLIRTGNRFLIGHRFLNGHGFLLGHGSPNGFLLGHGSLLPFLGRGPRRKRERGCLFHIPCHFKASDEQSNSCPVPVESGNPASDVLKE